MTTAFRRALTLNTLVLAGAMLCGLSFSEPPAAAAPAAAPAAVPERAPGLVSGAVFVFSRNMIVVGALLLGVCTFGPLTVMTVAWNGYQLGFGFGTLQLASPERAMWVGLYVPIEFGALLIASSAALELSRQLWLTLFHGRDFRPRVGTALALSAVMLAIAAVVEALAARAIARL